MRVSNDENAVFVSGTLGGAPELSHSLYGEDFYSAELLVPRLSGTMDHVPLTIPGAILPSCRTRATGFLYGDS